MVMHDLLAGGVHLLSHLQKHGLCIDWDAQKAMVEATTKEVALLHAQMRSEASKAGMADLRCGFSSKGLQAPLWGLEAALPESGEADPAGAMSTNEEVLKLLAERKHAFPALMLKHREADKTRQFVEGLSAFIKPDGMVHPDFSIVDSRSGRSTAYDPAAQTWPKAKAIRALVKSRFPNGSIIEVDEATFELRMLACVSRDPCMIEAFAKNLDLHSWAANFMFGFPLELAY